MRHRYGSNTAIGGKRQLSSEKKSTYLRPAVDVEGLKSEVPTETQNHLHRHHSFVLFNK